MNDNAVDSSPISQVEASNEPVEPNNTSSGNHALAPPVTSFENALDTANSNDTKESEQIIPSNDSLAAAMINIHNVEPEPQSPASNNTNSSFQPEHQSPYHTPFETQQQHTSPTTPPPPLHTKNQNELSPFPTYTISTRQINFSPSEHTKLSPPKTSTIIQTSTDTEDHSEHSPLSTYSMSTLQLQPSPSDHTEPSPSPSTSTNIHPSTSDSPNTSTENKSTEIAETDSVSILPSFLNTPSLRKQTLRRARSEDNLYPRKNKTLRPRYRAHGKRL